MGIHTPGAPGSSSGNPYREMHDEPLPPGAAPAYPTPAPAPFGANLASAGGATGAPRAASAGYPMAGAVYYPTTNVSTNASHAGSLAAPAMAFPVHSNPVHFAPGPISGVPRGPDEGPWSDRCCENRCCCGACHDCCYPADKCCRCPPWFLVTAYVLVCVSFLVNFGALAPFFRLSAEVDLAGRAAVAEGWSLDAAAEAKWAAADEHYLILETFFDGRGIDAVRSLSTEYEEDLVRGSEAHVWTATDHVDCARVEAFYADGRPTSRRRRWASDEDEGDEDGDEDEGDEDGDEDEDEYDGEYEDAPGEQEACWAEGTCSAAELDYFGIWPSDGAVAAVATRGACEETKRRLRSAGGAEVAIRALTFPLGFLLVALFGVLVSRCSEDCRRNTCHANLPAVGRACFYTLAFVAFVDMVCFAHYANTFPDMADREAGEEYDVVPSAVFALILPTAVDRLRLVAVGDLSWFEMDRGGFGVSVFVWLAHVAALALAALAARDDARDGFADGYVAGPPRSVSRMTKGWGRWYRPERENDPMPPDVQTSAPNAMQMPPYPAVHRTF